MSRREPRAQYSVTMHGGLEQAPRNMTMLGWRSTLISCVSFLSSSNTLLLFADLQHMKDDKCDNSAPNCYMCAQLLQWQEVSRPHYRKLILVCTQFKLAQGSLLLVSMQMTIPNWGADGIHIVTSYFIIPKVKEISSVCHTRDTQIPCKVCLCSRHWCCDGGLSHATGAAFVTYLVLWRLGLRAADSSMLC